MCKFSRFFYNTIGGAIIAVVRVVVVDIAGRVHIPDIVRVAQISGTAENILRSYQPTSQFCHFAL